MKFIVKVLAEHIKQSYEMWDDERKNINTQNDNTRKNYNAMIRATLITNYGILTSMYENHVITLHEMRLLDRYNDRIKSLYRI